MGGGAMYLDEPTTGMVGPGAKGRRESGAAEGEREEWQPEGCPGWLPRTAGRSRWSLQTERSGLWVA